VKNTDNTVSSAVAQTWESSLRLLGTAKRAQLQPVLAGFDGFVDTILHVVSERRSATEYSRVPTLQAFSEKVLAASGGRNMNIEMVPRLTKIKKLTIERGTAWPTPIWVGLMRLPSPIDTVKVRRAELMPGTEFVRLPGNET
jgi:hypothetical protein